MNKIIVDKDSNVNTIQKAIDLIDINQDNEIFIKNVPAKKLLTHNILQAFNNIIIFMN